MSKTLSPDELRNAWSRLSDVEQRELRHKLLKKKARTDLGAFGEYVFNLKPAPHHQQILDLLTKYPEDDLLIVAPPRHAKTTWVGVIYPLFRIMQDPSVHVVYVSSTIEQSLKQSIEVRDSIETNDYFKQVCDDVFPAKNRQWQKNMWTIRSQRWRGDKDPTFIATGFDGNILGSTADEIIIDDLNDRKNTATPYMRQKVQDWVARTVLTRRSPRGRVVCIMTRWHADDLAGWFKTLGFKCLEMQAIGCGGCNIDHQHRPKDAPLWKEEWSFEKLLKVKTTMDIWQWEGVYQGNPTPIGGTIWKEEWWRYYRTDFESPAQKELPSLPQDYSLKIQSWDTSQKEGSENDWSVCETWQYEQGNYYLIDVYRAKHEYPDLKKAVIEQYRKHYPGVVLIEEASSGASLVQEMPIETSVPIIGIKPETDKLARAKASTPPLMAGRVFLPAAADWLYTFVQEHSDFPQGKWRDQVDATSQALTWIRTNTGDGSDALQGTDDLRVPRSHWSPTAADALGGDILIGEDWGLSRWSRFD